MEKKSIINPFFDLKDKEVRSARFFFLEHVLKARADLNMESGRHASDQELNVYIAGLLNSLLTDSDSFLKTKSHISPFDVDVRAYIDSHPGKRNEYIVYRDNADFGLMVLGLFDDYEHKGSYKKFVLTADCEQGRVALYYELAASALTHLQGNSASLVTVFESMAENMKEVLQILHRAAKTYFEIMERLSEGSAYHLQREIEQMDNRESYNRKLDDFLKLYSLYKENPGEEIRNELLIRAEELKKLNSKFSFDEL
ncbi:MAG: hypothetical protein ACLFQB_01400 [Chitinispirillaceae bacterium]